MFLKVLLLSILLPVSTFAAVDTNVGDEEFDYRTERNLSLKDFNQSEQEALDVASLVVSWVQTCSSYLDPEAAYVFLEMTGFSVEVSYARYIQKENEPLIVRPDIEGYDKSLKEFVQTAFEHRGTSSELSFTSFFLTLDNMRRTAACYGIFAEVTKNHQLLIQNLEGTGSLK